MDVMQKPVMVVGTSAEHRRSMAASHFAGAYEIVGLSPDIDEKEMRDPDPFVLTNLIACAKMAALVKRVEGDAPLRARIAQRPGSVAVTFDQVVDYHGTIREKPESAEEATAFIKAYSNDVAKTVMTAALYDFRTKKTVTAPNVTVTKYGAISDAAVARIVARGICFYTAGAFVVEDEDMKDSRIAINPGTEEEVQGFSFKSVLACFEKLRR